MEYMECLNKDVKKKGQVLYIVGRKDQIAMMLCMSLMDSVLI